MSTTSTKSRAKKKQAPAEENASGDGLSVLKWRIASASILITGTFLRLYDLALVPFHHDEGVNGNFLVTLVREGRYQYDPQNYHGPTLYFFSAVIPWIVRFFGGKSAGDVYGLTTFNIRFVTAAFGVGTIWLALLLRKRLGAIGALSAAGLIAISPGAVYLSRYFIHESLFVFFALAIVVAALKYYESGRSGYLILASISAALMCATKETWIINGPVLLIALVTTSVYFRLRGSVGERAQKTVERFGGSVSLTTVALVAFAVFLIVNVLFYSSFFTNYPKGVHDAISTLRFWSHRTHEHEHPWWQYLQWLMQEEPVLLVLAGAGAAIALWRATNRLAVFLALWSFGSLAAYSLVGYKTPWISLNFIVPLALTGGYALDSAYQKLREFEQPLMFAALAALCVAIGGYQMISLNFVHYDDDRYPYVYAHTKREMLTMLDQVDRIAKRLRTGDDTGVALVSPDYWPLPWYFRNYKRVGYYQQIVPTTEPLIIGSMAQEEQLKATFGDRYQLVNSGLNDDGSYPLRPGVDLLLYVRRDVAR
ncbi:MAG TPA: flippase activity-associated protein Agl23 [Pyrinomonadaceae bacterium]|nr:flippase activity-associated protein Agl23 [Pyrinomonadaceae bacterium]